MPPKDVEEVFRRFRQAMPEPKTELQLLQPLHAARRRRAFGAGDRRRRQQGDAGALRQSRYAGEDGQAWRSGGHRTHSHHRPLPHQGAERGGAVAHAHRRARRQGAGQSRGAGEVAGRRAQDRQRRYERRFRRSDARRRYAHLSSRQPHRHGTGTRSSRRGGRARTGRAGRVQTPRPPLAHPARSLCVPCAEAALP